MLELTTIGWVHTIFGLLAVISGTIVILNRKGSRLHRAWGYLYLFSMLSTNATALLIYELTGRLNFFHYSAFFSLATLIIGMLPVFTRRPPRKRWMLRHAHFMSGSYIGVVAATLAEITSRVPGWDIGLATGITVAIVSAIGIYLIQTRTEQAIANINPRRAGRLSSQPGD